MPPRELGETPRRYYGKHAGVVLDNGPPETGPHRGVLRVEVPAILEEVPSGDGTRPIQLRAHPCLPPGFFFLPKVGDHVWVEFASGELEQPIWTGVWYPEGKAPPDWEGLVLSDHQGNRVSLDALLTWVREHRHLGNMGSPTPVFAPDLATATPWSTPKGGT